LGCPDWPLCQGQALPPPERTALIEFSHRAWGGVTSLFIVAAAVFWIRVTRARRLALLASFAMGLLLLAQILLGALTVALELSPPVVTVHLGMALLLFGALVWLAVEANLADNGQETGGRQGLTGLGVAVAAVYLLMLTGALVRASSASWACVGFPACNGQALPFGVHPLTDLHLLHRLTALAVAAYLAATVVGVWHRSRRRGQRLAAAAVGVSVVAQIAIGAGMVSTGVPAVAQALHVAGAAAVWGSVVALFAITSRARLESQAALTTR
jgi:heme A synthase